MKKLLFFAGFILVSMTVNAQWYIGGGINLGVTSVNSGGQSATISQFGLSPEIGYYLNDKTDVGLDFTFGMISDGDATDTEWLIAPYIRYAFLRFGNFEISGKAALGFGQTPGTMTINGQAISGTITQVGFNITPVLVYGIDEHFSLFSGLNFASFGINYHKMSDVDLSTFGFGLTADSFNVATLGNITVGFTYKF